MRWNDFGGHVVIDWYPYILNHQEGQPISYMRANSDLIVYVTYAQTFLGTLLILCFMQVEKPLLYLSVSFNALTCVSHDWGCCLGNHESIIPSGEKSDKTQHPWMQPVCLWTQYFTYSTMPAWTDCCLWKREHAFWPNDYLTLATIIFLQVAHYYLTH